MEPLACAGLSSAWAGTPSSSHPDRAAVSCQGQLELLRLLFTEALYDEYLSRVSGSASQAAQEPWPGLPLGLCSFLASPELPVAFEALQSELLLQLARAQLFVLCAVVHSRRLSVPLCPRRDQWPRHRNQVMGLGGCSLQGTGDVGCEWLHLTGGEGEAGLKTSSWLCPTLSHPSARP